MESTLNIKYSVVVPAFNSYQTINQLCLEIVETFKSIHKTFEIVIVNDGGNIATWKQIEDAFNTIDCKISIIRLSKNYGQHNATLCGIQHSIGEAIITIDDDLQIKPLEIVKLVNEYEIEFSDVVYGIYTSKKYFLPKNFGSSYFKKASKILLNTPGKGSSFRLISRQLANKILDHSQSFVYIDELLLWYTDNISFVQVQHQELKINKSRYSIFKLILMSFNITTIYTALPLKLITYIGIISSIITFFLGSYFIYRKIFHHVPIGFTSIIVTVLFSSSIILYSLGVLGQYIFKLYQVQNKKPSFSVKKKISK